MSDSENDSEIYFSVKFLGRLEVTCPVGMEILMEAAAALQKEKKKKNKVHLFLSRRSIDILQFKTKFMMYSCTLSSVSFCAVHQIQSKLFGFMAKHPALDSHHCYVFQSTKFSHLLASVIGDAVKASRRSDSVRGSRDLVVEALRHKNKLLQRENAELRNKLQGKAGIDSSEEETDNSETDRPTSHVRFNSGRDTTTLQRNL
ncbi:PTB domain-containing engulfment adapter protein 1-like [Tachysurus fulvidraco]|uniref:PTB domain-containing engulfment adapter protein 1-like n=1 Tax=Tachysurus fulvidraco TaxID=1234273 RepID=UPI000F4FAEA7|nr:PTB domain-containing engulfment adapter protein 1-like [Tachysurus fulvidraco]XP_027024259.1 PTB domain-containing engulfment adapter protein 1-like [Tachysurus fulvidraco]